MDNSTPAELAERAGVSQTVVARYEARQQQPTIPALERLVTACGYQLEWTVRHATDSGAMPGATERSSIERFPGPIGRRLTAALDEVLTVLATAGATDPHLHGEVADGTEGVGCLVLIGVTVPPDSERLPLLAASGHIGLLVGASVHVLPHTDVAAYGYDDVGTPLVPRSARAMGTPAR